MAGEKVYADPEIVGRLDGQPLVNEAVLADMQGLIDAHKAYDDSDTLHHDEITDLTVRIKELEAQRQVLLDARSGENTKQHRLRASFGSKLTHALQDPHLKISPIYRAALLAPTLDQGSHWYPDTFRYAEKFGRDLLVLNETLRTAEKSQPVVMIKGADSMHPFKELYAHYAMTTPRAELKPQVGREHVSTCGCGQKHYEPRPILDIPIVKQTLGAVKSHHFSPAYLTTTGRHITLSDGRTSEVAGSHDAIKAEPPVIPLATNNLHDGNNLIAVYERGGEVVELRGPRTMFGSETVCAIGERAVAALLDSVAEEGESEAKYPEVIKDMFAFVMNSLDLTPPTKS